MKKSWKKKYSSSFNHKKNVRLVIFGWLNLMDRVAWLLMPVPVLVPIIDVFVSVFAGEDEKCSFINDDIDDDDDEWLLWERL